ncbi:DUF4288 domain-containing protein [Hymenobacter aquaticus]|uniref:DUF4288 domain-containing protein n=1 Tax=Hymenobacter aquaticus TaxID=1867101 RepID=A0A4Z0QA31_9BACT|nr:DUF4288 domain-containing protein [Hymenobacter aquaticus]TGE25592.1 DUF4288 domain-containing protein [Hymenobacter aquaticus]
MSKILNENQWKLETAAASAVASITIHFPWPDVDQLKHLVPEKRKAAIDDLMRGHLDQVVGSGLLQSHTIEYVGHRRPRSLKAEVVIENLPVLCQLPDVDRISILNVAGLRKKRQRSSKRLEFYCVKMTVAIQIEGDDHGMQSYEERYVLIKAASFEDAYERLEATRADYGKPYLNSDGYFVRWQIESLDDCYQTIIESTAEFSQPEGVEVFSVLKKRKLTPERAWDGK